MTSCPWCANPIPPQAQRRGEAKRFCSNSCRTRYWSASRRIGVMMLEDLDAVSVHGSPLRDLDPIWALIPPAARDAS
jgi:hypothetical protein